jgi:hypothetical protein
MVIRLELNLLFGPISGRHWSSETAVDCDFIQNTKLFFCNGVIKTLQVSFSCLLNSVELGKKQNMSETFIKGYYQIDFRRGLLGPKGKRYQLTMIQLVFWIITID